MKGSVEMNTLSQFNDAMRYIEENLTEEINIDYLSQIAGCSKYHFSRMFSFLAGMPLSEYIRKRKLTVAGMTLSSSQEKIITISLQFGYESPEAFSKAFLSMHGITPSQARRDKAQLKAFPPMTFQLSIQGGIEMDYRIVEKPKFNIIGFKKQVSLQFNGINLQIESLAKKLTPEIIGELKALCDIEPKGMLSVSTNFDERTTEGSKHDQYLGVATTKELPNNYDVLHVDSSSWAVFSVVGKFPEALQNTWSKIYSEWLPSSQYEIIQGPEILWNESPDTTKSDYRSEIWIPVKKVK